MRIGIDASCWLNRRGFGRYTRELVRAMLRVDQDHEYVLFLDADTARQSEALPPPDRVTRVVVPTSAAATQAASADGSRAIADLWRMRRAVAEWGNRLDIFHFPAVYTYFPVRTPARVVVTKHDMTDRRCPELLFPSWRSRVFWEAKVRMAMRRADFVFTVSESSRRDILASFPIPPERVRVVADAVDESFELVEDGVERRAVLARYGIQPGQRFLLYVGGISPHKNIETLLDAYRLWRSGAQADDAEVQLVLVGDFAADVFYSSYPAIQQRIRDEGIENDVRFMGYVPDQDLVHFYSASDAFVLPSFSEGFGLPALEAMACGTPTVVADAGALPEVVGDAGLLFDPRSSEALAAVLTSLLADAARRADLGIRGRARAASFTWDASAHAALAAFEELVS